MTIDWDLLLQDIPVIWRDAVKEIVREQRAAAIDQVITKADDIHVFSQAGHSAILLSNLRAAAAEVKSY